MIYIFSLISSVWLANTALKRSTVSARVAALMAYSIIILFAGLRVDAGYDYGSYVQLLDNNFFVVLFEPVPAFYGYLAKYTGINQVFFLLCSTTLGLALFYFVKTDSSRAIFLALYFGLPFCFLDSFSLVRQYLALSFFLLAYKFYSRNIWSSILFLALGIFSHKTAPLAAFILIAATLFNKIIVHKIAKLAFVIPTCVFLITYFLVPFTGFLETAETETFVGFKGPLIILLIGIPALLNLKKYSRRYSDPIALIALIGIGLYAGLGLYGYFVSRFFVYLAPFVVLFFARSFQITLRGHAVIISTALSAVCVIGLLYSAANNPSFDFLNGYKFFPAECMNCKIRPNDGEF